MTDRWTGIKDKHIEDCARNAPQTNKPGVIVIAAREKEKVGSILESVKRGWINHLFIDQILADAIIQYQEQERTEQS